MNKILLIFLMLFCVTINISAQPVNNPLVSSSGNILDTASPKTGLLFVHTARAGILTRISKDSDQFYLTLYDMSPYISYFSDRPERINGIVPFANFSNAWTVGQNSYAVDPPNAVITATKINGEYNQGNQNFLVILSNLQYTSPNLTARYTVTPLGTQKILINEYKLDYVTVFIG